MIKNSIYIPLLLVSSGTTPTIPNPVSLKYDDNGFDIENNLMIGQQAYNVIDDIWYYRSKNNIKQFNSFINVTYNQLVSLIINSGLTENSKYKIIDYKTVHYMLDGDQRTEDINISNIEPLIVTSLNNNTISNIAFSEMYPQDIIYYDWNPQNWIQDISFANAEIITGSYLNPDLSGVNIISGFTGVIYKREDTKNNNILGYDFRNVKFRRWEYNYPEWSGTTNYNNGDIVKYGSIYISLISNNYGNTPGTDYNSWGEIIKYNYTKYFCPYSSSALDIEDYIDVLTFYENDEWNTYEVSVKNNIFYNLDNTFTEQNFGRIPTCLTNNVFYLFSNDSYNQESKIFNNIINYYELNTILDPFYNNNIGYFFSNNIINNNFTENIIGKYFQYNIINNDCYSNSISDYFYSNKVTYFIENSIGINFAENNIGTEFSNNSIKNNFRNNNIGYNFYGNNIGYNFQNNNIEKCLFYNNNIGNYFSYNYLTYINDINNFENNDIENNFYGNFIDCYFNYNNIGKYFQYNIIKIILNNCYIFQNISNLYLNNSGNTFKNILIKNNINFLEKSLDNNYLLNLSRGNVDILKITSNEESPWLNDVVLSYIDSDTYIISGLTNFEWTYEGILSVSSYTWSPDGHITIGFGILSGETFGNINPEIEHDQIGIYVNSNNQNYSIILESSGTINPFDEFSNIKRISINYKTYYPIWNGSQWVVEYAEPIFDQYDVGENYSLKILYDI